MSETPEIGSLWKARDGRVLRLVRWNESGQAVCEVVARLARYQQRIATFRRESFGTFLMRAAAQEGS